MTCIAQGHTRCAPLTCTRRTGINRAHRLPCLLRASRFAPVLVVCGGGHVGAQVLALGRTLGFETVLVDDRDRRSDCVRDRTCRLFCTSYRLSVRSGAVARCTRRVFRAVQLGTRAGSGCALRRTSKSKRPISACWGKPKIRQIFAALREQGITQRALDEVCTPIGLDLGAQTPAEVAVSIMSEILTVRTGASGAAV